MPDSSPALTLDSPALAPPEPGSRAPSPDIQQPETRPGDDRAGAWSPAQRFGFRVAFIYFGVYTLDLYTSYWLPISFLRFKGVWYDYLVQKPAHWLSGHLLDSCAAGSRGAYNCWAYDNLWLLVLGLAGAVVWTLADRRRPHYRRLHAWLRTAMRYFLAMIMWLYAYDKFVGVQFGRGPEGDALHTALGDTSPMQLMWGTMGYSFIYGTFTGLGELAGTVLLLFRRTTTLGALIVVMIMANVSVLDIVHRVGISEKAFNYMLMAAFLVLPDTTRLINFYFRNRPLPPATLEPPLFPIRPAVKLAVVAFALFLSINFLWGSRSYIFHVRARPSLNGIYRVERFIRNGDTLTPRMGDSTRWDRVGMGTSGVGGAGTVRMDPSGKVPAAMQVLTMDGKWKPYGFLVDTIQRWMLLTQGRPVPTAALAARRDSAKAKPPAARPKAAAAKSAPPRAASDTLKAPKFLGAVTYEWVTSDRLHLVGRVSGARIDALLRRVEDTTWVMRSLRRR